MNNDEKFLPLGTIVLLKNAKKKVMITGFYMVNKEKYYDYCGCLYPEGFLTSDSCVLFNKNEIEKIYFTGFIDSEFIEFNNNLNNFIKSKGD